MKILKVLAINSFPANGNAGLKMVMSVLGTQVLPVPTLLLSGIGNMPGHQRYPVPFAELLDSTLTMARQNGYQLIVYVGYLGSADQAGIIADTLARFPDLVKFVLIDPVCGDNGKPYTSEAIIDSWHYLLPLANLALPNLTEIALLAKTKQPIDLTEPEPYLSAFCQQYPNLDCIVTGVVTGDTITNRWISADSTTDFSHIYHPHYFSGTGDTFASLLVRYRFFEHLSVAEAIERAGLTLEQLIASSVLVGSRELIGFDNSMVTAPPQS
jgi:pyridoxine kinase